MDNDLATLQRSVRRLQFLVASLLLATGVVALGALRNPGGGPDPSDEVRTRRLVVVDDAGVPRVVIQQDPPNQGRRSRNAGITVHDSTGSERGGFGTMASGDVVLAMDAPTGVGSPMRDRLGMVVGPDGSAYIMLIDNRTRAVARLESNGSGAGGLKVFQWDTVAGQIRVRSVRYPNDTHDSIPIRRTNP